jgi:hypothetical protein
MPTTPKLATVQPSGSRLFERHLSPGEPGETRSLSAPPPQSAAPRWKFFSHFFPLGSSLVTRGGRLKVPVRIRAGENLFLSFPVFEASLVVGGSAISKSLNRFLQGETREGNKGSQVKTARITPFSFVFSKFFSLWREQFLCGVGDREPAQAKVTVEKTPKWAGATPLFRLSAAQKVRGVAPAHMLAPSELFGEGGRPCC